MKRRTFLAGLGAVAVVGLAACNGGGSATPLSKDTEASLSLAFWDKDQAVTVEENLKAFNKMYPKITVTTNITGYRDYWSKLRTQAEGSNLPDVFWMNGPNIQLYATNGMLAPIDDVKDVDWANYPKALVDLYTVSGKHYGVPKDYDTIACWVNKKIFADAGVELPKADWTWDDFRAAAKKISDSGKGYGVVAEIIGGGQESYYNTIAQAGGFVVKDGKSGYGDAKTIEGLQIWADLIKDGSMPALKVMGDTNPAVLFQSNKAAMFWAGSWQAGVFNKEYADKANLMVVPLPKKETQATIIHGLGYVASAKSKNLQAAKTLIAFMTSKASNENEAKNGTAIPAFKGTEVQWTKMVDSWNLDVYTKGAQEYSVAYPVSQNTSAWNKVENELLVPAFQGKADVASASKELAEEMNQLLAKEGK